MIGVDKKPLKKSFWLLVISTILSVSMYVFIIAQNFEYIAYWFTTPLRITEMLGLLVAPIYLCIHMKLQQRCKTDFLFPVAFCILFVMKTVSFIYRLWELILWFKPSFLLSTVLSLTQVLLTAAVILEYFIIKKPIVSLMSLFGLFAHHIYWFVNLLANIRFYITLDVDELIYQLVVVISPCLMYIACIIYTFLRMKYVKTLKHATYDEKEQMLRVLKMQHDEGKFSARQYARRKKEILKYL